MPLIPYSLMPSLRETTSSVYSDSLNSSLLWIARTKSVQSSITSSRSKDPSDPDSFKLRSTIRCSLQHKAGCDLRQREVRLLRLPQESLLPLSTQFPRKDIFSVANFLHEKTRNHLTPENANLQMFIYINSRVLAQDPSGGRRWWWTCWDSKAGLLRKGSFSHAVRIRRQPSLMNQSRRCYRWVDSEPAS
jgi:hypothetical protein